jgi:hypothetical protein
MKKVGARIAVTDSSKNHDPDAVFFRTFLNKADDLPGVCAQDHRRGRAAPPTRPDISVFL